MAKKVQEETDCNGLRTIEIEAVMTKTIFHASCSTDESTAACSPKHISCPPEPFESVEEPSNEKSPKTRKFKNIALPNWLVKPHAKKSHEEGSFGKHLYGNKKKILRVNSAPKHLGSGGLKFAFKDQQCNTIAEGPEVGLTVPTEIPVRPRNPGLMRQISDEIKEKRGNVWRRRASLPSHVGNNFDEVDVTESSQHISGSLTPKAQRKHVNPSDKMEKDVLKALLFGRSNSGTNKNSSKQTIYPEVKRTTDETRENEERPDCSHYGNGRQKPRLQLHRLETPDMFFVPVTEEESDVSRLVKKVSTSTGELCTAVKIDSEENERIQTLICQNLKSYLEDKTFTAELCQKWCLDISQSVKNSLQNCKGDNYKVVCVTYIAALRGKGVHAAVRCLWTPNQDSYATASYKNESLYAFSSVMATKYE